MWLNNFCEPRRYEFRHFGISTTNHNEPTITRTKSSNMSRLRGRGRVVPRTLGTAPQQPASESSDVVLRGFTVGHASSHTHAVASHKPAAVALHSAAPVENSSSWRCAEFVTANSRPVQQLSPSHLGSAAGRQALASGQPLLLKQLWLAMCRLNKCKPQCPNDRSAVSSSSTQSSNDATVHERQLAQSSPAQHLPGSQQAESALQIPVLCSPALSNRFIVPDSSKNRPGSYYHVRKPETATLHMTFLEWLTCWQSWTNNRLLLQAHVFDWELEGSVTTSRLRVRPNKATYPHLHQLLSSTAAAAPAGPSTHDSSKPQPAAPTTTAASTTTAAASLKSQEPSVQQVLDWALLQQLLHSGRWVRNGSLQLLAGGRDALLPASYQTTDRLFCQVGGKQQVLLLPPDLAFRGLYPYPVHHTYDRYSAVDWEDPELEHWQAAAQVSGLLCELSPGDTLLVPAYWFVHRQLSQPACVCLELQLQPQPTRLQPPSALLVQLSRMMELWFAAEVGPANIRSWFLALSEGREWQLLEHQLLTVKGYKLLRCCQMALQHLQQVIALDHKGSSSSNTCSLREAETDPQSSTNTCTATVPPTAPADSASWLADSRALEGAARQVLGLMCDGRLIRTSWLNEGIDDLLYLQHPPRYYLIEEDAEAARYSSMFKHRLIANRADWVSHATPLQLAPPGSRRSLIQADKKEVLALASP